MKRVLIAALALIGLGITLPSPAHAATATYTPSISVSETPQVGVATTFSTESNPPARIQWSWQYPSGGGYKVGGQMGEGSTVNYAFPASAATKAYVVVVVKVTSAGGTNNFVIGQRAFYLSAPAQAALRISNCQVQYNVNSLPMSNTAWCLSANGAGTQVRAATLCWDYNYSHSMVWVYGPWVYVGSYSHVWCTVARPDIYTGTYQTR